MGSRTLSGTHTITVTMNNRDITVLTALRGYTVFSSVHTLTPLPRRRVWKLARSGVSEVEWSNGDTLQASGLSGWPVFVMYGATRVKFKLYDADAVLVINFWNTGEVFAP